MYNDMCALFLDEQIVYVDDGIGAAGARRDDVREIGDRHVMIVKNHGAIFLGDASRPPRSRRSPSRSAPGSRSRRR